MWASCCVHLGRMKAIKMQYDIRDAKQDLLQPAVNIRGAALGQSFA